MIITKEMCDASHLLFLINRKISSKTEEIMVVLNIYQIEFYLIQKCMIIILFVWMKKKGATDNFV